MSEISALLTSVQICTYFPSSLKPIIIYNILISRKISFSNLKHFSLIMNFMIVCENSLFQSKTYGEPMYVNSN